MWKTAFILLLLPFNVFAQDITFSKAFDPYSGNNFPFGVAETDSGYAVMGRGVNRPETDGWRGCVFVKTDIYGNMILKNYYGKKTFNYWQGWQGFIKVSTGGYAAGVTESDSAAGGLEAALIRYNEQGDTVFIRRYSMNYYDRAHQVLETPDQGFIMAGESVNPGSAFYLVKTDSIGNLQWQNSYVHTANSRGMTCALAHDGGYVMSGWGYTPGYDLDTYIVKTDSSGNEQWIRRYGTKKDDGGGLITLSSDSTYVVYGGIDTFNLTTNTGQKLWSWYVMKIDMDGEIIWRYITDFKWYQQIAMVHEVAPGKGYIAVGQTYDEFYGAYNAYGWLLRFDNDGNILWERKYAYPNPLKNNDLAYSSLYQVQPTSDSGFICLGIALNDRRDFWLLKLDSLGCMGDYCGLTDTNCYYKPYPNCLDDTVGVGEVASIKEQDIRLRVYPNPANELVFFHPTSKYITVEQIRLYDTQGRMVMQKKYAGNLSIAHLAAGIYYYEVVIDDAMLPSQSEHPVRGKIIKQ